MPLGSMMEQKNKGRARVKIAVSFVLIIHGIGLLALLVQGCHKDETTTQKTAEQTPAEQTTTPQFATSNTNITTDTSTQTPVNNTQGEVTKTTTDNTTTGPLGGGEYIIAKGDTYGAIATKNHVTVKALEEANPGVDPKKLQIGKKLHIPAQPLPSATTASTGTAGAVETTSNGEKMYTVKSGDMLITIAKANATTVRAIKSANNLTTDSIKVGQKLKIPAKVVETAASNSPATPATR